MADDAISNDQFMVNIPSNLAAQIDAQVGAEFVDREDFIRAATRFYLDHLQSRGSSNDRMFLRG